jgi:acyl-CoA reductase-like NAD-dependent aldehyde dehydrogenase
MSGRREDGSPRLGVRKTYKLYVGGAFVRSESGRSLPLHAPAPGGGEGELVANYCRASRKDLREAIRAARKAFAGWSDRAPYNRGQILYRIGEMLEDRRAEFVETISREAGWPPEKAGRMVEKSIDRLVWYAGWADKFAAVLGTVNPVADSYFSFTVPEAMGVVGILAAEKAPLLGLVSQMAPVVVSGNTTVIVAPDRHPLSACIFGEVLATSDVPGGVVNLLTGSRAELLPHLVAHMDVNALDYPDGDPEAARALVRDGAVNVKRVRADLRLGEDDWLDDAKSQSPYWIERFVEMKTVWHPIGV